jgi:hypothetical protein
MIVKTYVASRSSSQNIAKMTVPSGLRSNWRKGCSVPEPEEPQAVGGLNDEDAEAEKPKTPYKLARGRNHSWVNQVCLLSLLWSLTLTRVVGCLAG